MNTGADDYLVNRGVALIGERFKRSNYVKRYI